MNIEQGYAILEHPQGAFPNFLSWTPNLFLTPNSLRELGMVNEPGFECKEPG
jgi:hypothetical protein